MCAEGELEGAEVVPAPAVEAEAFGGEELFAWLMKRLVKIWRCN